VNKLSITVWLTFAAVACAPVPAAPSATATTVPLIPTQTITPVAAIPTILPTSTPTATPTITPTPSPTPRPKTGAADEWLGQGTEREALFDEYAQTIKDAQVFSELGFKRLGTTWEKELARARQRFLEADTKLDVYYALLSLQRSFHDARSSLTVPGGLTPPSDKFSLPFTLAVRGDSLDNAQYIVVQSSLSEVKAGFLLKQYGAKTIQQLEYDFSEWLDNTSPEQLRMELAKALTRTSPSQYPSPDMNAPVTIVFTDPANQKETSVLVRWQRGVTDAPSEDYEGLTLDYTGINYRIYKDTVNQTIVLVYPSFNYLRGEDVDTQNLGNYLNQQTLANLVMDVRDNTGGNINTNLIALFARERFRILTRELVFVPVVKRDRAFFEESLTLADNYMRKLISDYAAREKDAARSPRFPFFCKTANCSTEEATYEPNLNVRKFNFAILSGPKCMSSCDQFVSIVKDNNIGQVVGLPSRGAHSPMRAKKESGLKNGDKFSMIFTTGIGYRANGEPLEGNSAKVDYYLFPEDDYIGKIIQYLKASGSLK